MSGSDPKNLRDKRGLLVGYKAAAFAVFLNEHEHKVLGGAFGSDVEVHKVARMPEPELPPEPMPEALPGISARNARRLAKKKRK